MAEGCVRAGMLRRAIVRVDHVASACSRWRDNRRADHWCRAARATDRAGAFSAGQETLGRFAAVCRNRARPICRPGVPGFFLAIRIADFAFFPPPRSKTRSTLPGCEISQRSSGVNSGTTPFSRVSSGVGGGIGEQLLRHAVRRVAFTKLRVLSGKRAVVVERRAPQHPAMWSSCWFDTLQTSARVAAIRRRTFRRRRADRPD